jgi:hypothetical protein
MPSLELTGAQALLSGTPVWRHKAQTANWSREPRSEQSAAGQPRAGGAPQRCCQTQLPNTHAAGTRKRRERRDHHGAVALAAALPMPGVSTYGFSLGPAHVKVGSRESPAPRRAHQHAWSALLKAAGHRRAHDGGVLRSLAGTRKYMDLGALSLLGASCSRLQHRRRRCRTWLPRATAHVRRDN